MAKPFQGVINLDIRDSTPDWAPYLADRAPQGSPTGRNHQNGFATIAETATGFPGNNTHIPMENAFCAEVLRERGWNTFWVGKNHNIPVDEFDMVASKRNWP